MNGNPFYGSPVATLTSHSDRFVMGENGMELINKDEKILVTFLCSKLDESGKYQISDDVEIIGWYAFNSCSNIRSVTLHEKLRTIYGYAFYSSGLELIEILQSVKYIGTNAFSICGSLSKLSIEEGMKGSIEGRIQSNSSLTELTLPESLWRDDSQIDDYAFEDSNLTTITFSCGKDDTSCVPESKTYKGKDVSIVCGECPAEQQQTL